MKTFVTSSYTWVPVPRNRIVIPIKNQELSFKVNEDGTAFVRVVKKY